MTKKILNTFSIGLVLLLLISLTVFSLPVSAQSVGSNGSVIVEIRQQSEDSDGNGRPDVPDKDPNTGKETLPGGKESSENINSGMIEVAGSGTNPLVEVPDGSKPIGKLPATGSHNILLISLFALSGIFFFAYYHTDKKAKSEL